MEFLPQASMDFRSGLEKKVSFISNGLQCLGFEVIQKLYLNDLSFVHQLPQHILVDGRFGVSSVKA